MFIAGLGTAAPPNRYAQADCWEALQAAPQFSRLLPRSRAILRKVLRGGNGIQFRHLALNPLAEALDLNPDTLHARFTLHAPALAVEAAEKALRDAGLQASQIDALIISTCTGYLCPGLTSYVSQRLGLRPDTLCLDLVGQGCGAAIPNLRTGASLITSGQCARLLSVCVEVCSAAFYLDDDPGVLISACLFGDGAGAAVLTGDKPQNKRALRWHSSRTLLCPEDRDLLRFEQRGGMLRNLLSPAVPNLAAGHVEKVLRETLKAAGRSRSEINAWIMHAGGRDVLKALCDRLELTDQQVRHSAEVLLEFGNVSSPCVYFVLEATLRNNAPAGLWWMSSFGAGFSCHGALLEVE